MHPFAEFGPLSMSMSMETWGRVWASYSWIFLVALVIALNTHRSRKLRSNHRLKTFVLRSTTLANVPILCWALAANHRWEEFLGRPCSAASIGPEAYWLQGFDNFLALCLLCCLQTGFLALRGLSDRTTVGINHTFRLATLAAMASTFLDTFFFLWVATPWPGLLNWY